MDDTRMIPGDEVIFVWSLNTENPLSSRPNFRYVKTEATQTTIVWHWRKVSSPFPEFPVPQ
ncbi:hypothetical protein WN51_10313 [Melipona quadrifasciata]|uniref:Uncharacterized protein n=1 Tax=Melipona quadrifasciata TaxID=166423 RepID=A0A0M9A701_9HYME|nr:hypothetical protein WN51_10313 [Melipona quadrifasciata]